MEDALDSQTNHDLVFVTSAVTRHEATNTRLLVDSIRAFGGDLRSAPITVFFEHGVEIDNRGWSGVEFQPLRVPKSIRGYELSDKVSACAEAERLLEGRAEAIVWLSSDTLIVNPPMQYLLDDDTDAALRPVHIRNVGSPVEEDPDVFWRGVLRSVGLQDMECVVESFVDGQRIRAYFNSHSYCVNPRLGLFREWLGCFDKLVNDAGFQEEACADELHRIFLHQAVLSALTVAMIPDERIRILPPTYSYPYNLQMSIPPDRRARTMNELASVVYEDLPMNPDEIEGIEIQEPLRSWLRDRSG